MSEWNPACHAGYDCQEHQRSPHHEGHFLWLAAILGILLVVRVTPEDDVIQTEHIECGHTRYESHEITHVWRELETSVHDLILGEETCQRPETADGDTADKETDVGDRHILVQSAHVLLEVAADNHDDSTGAEEEQCLEHSMCEQVEHTCHITCAALAFQGCADTQ